MKHIFKVVFVMFIALVITSMPKVTKAQEKLKVGQLSKEQIERNVRTDKIEKEKKEARKVHIRGFQSVMKVEA